MTTLAQTLRRRIEATGPLRVDDYIKAALSDPQYGYYATRDPFGSAGDFVTAPEISQVFGELVGAWCATVWAEMGAPEPVWLAELGPGRGTLMTDALRAISGAAPAFLDALDLALVENSPHLRAVQSRALNGSALTVTPRWFETFDEVPRGPLLLIANEFFDALPIRQLIWVAGHWRERRVNVNGAGDGFVFVTGEPAELAQPDDSKLQDGDLIEICPEANALASAIGNRIVAHGGAALVVDYGHAHSQLGETLQAVRRHHLSDVLDHPGATDLSHRVDFGALAAAVRNTGAGVFGPIPQGLFLGRIGIARRAEALIAAQPSLSQLISGQVRRLVDPARMGTLFKALAIGGPGTPALPGFGAPSAA